MTPGTRRFPRAAALAADQALVLANEQIQVGPLLFRKFHEDLLSFRILEALAVFLEEAVRSALAFDADEQRLLIVDALAQTVGAYLLVGIFFAYEVALYILASRWLGWWTPSDAVV